MEEKILITSTESKNFKKFLKWSPIIFFGIAAIISLFLTFEYDYRSGSRVGWELAFRFGSYTAFFVFFVIGSTCLLLSIIFAIIYFLRSREIQVTENFVIGKGIFGKEVVLPLHMVSAYSTRKLFSTITVSTPSGVIRVSFVQNYKEIGEVLATKIKENK